MSESPISSFAHWKQLASGKNLPSAIKKQTVFKIGIIMCAATGRVSEGLVDRIYECAFAPEHWPGVFDELAKIAGARGGFLFTANRKVISWTASASLQLGMQAFVAGDYYTRSSRSARGLASGHASFLRE